MWNLEPNIYLEPRTKCLFGNLELSIYLESRAKYLFGIRDQVFIWNLELSISLKV